MEKMDELCGGKGMRSSWVERWLEFAIAVQEEDKKAVDEWYRWAEGELDKSGNDKLYYMLLYAAGEVS